MALILWAGPIAVSEAAGSKSIKFSTLAPEGSSWMKQMRRLAKEVEKATGGSVKFKFYPGGISGDEKDVIRKMRIGQVHAAGFTGVGLGEILPEVRVLDLPFLFHNDKEIEHVYEKMNGYFARKFEEKGYILLGWVPVGWVHFFSKEPIRTVDDLQRAKAWMWEGDPLVEQTYRDLGVSPLPLSVTDVLLSLQTGMVDAVYASPMGALALQWFTKVNYMSELRMGNATGGVLMSKRMYKKLDDAQKKAVQEVSAKYLKILVQQIQKDNNQAIEVMKRNGLKISKMPEGPELDKFLKVGEQVRRQLNGKLYDQALLDQILFNLKSVP
jgi:TRAP-type C4-dicarboxylate transport system substrate-binding protein